MVLEMKNITFNFKNKIKNALKPLNILYIILVPNDLCSSRHVQNSIFVAITVKMSIELNNK